VHNYKAGNSPQKAQKTQKVLRRKSALEISFVTFELFVVSFSSLIYAHSSA
jgi:hypothetical protein